MSIKVLNPKYCSGIGLPRNSQPLVENHKVEEVELDNCRKTNSISSNLLRGAYGVVPGACKKTVSQ